ncbi:hypothetical protein HBI56_108920 [Parastagonospora nodorum]|nr:hypothetical protein HBI10_048300 [Parastagonospora nodorum]KAH4018606.1 hypothetical protein HBI13_134810 [Parastagonospora nodorum]KAH4230424.1 hypothetical protein HBI06_086840 [Parastagonospora nodorum]KAH4245573.1 hypothetical protein HBI05_069970 [Parastagonospora nodorum]KAH4350104.1 hypothetical protein HBH98_060820 [Parastagonospora nodorum]
MRLKANSDNAGSWHNPSRHRTCQSPCGSARRRLIERVRVLYAISLQACSVALDHGSHVILCGDAPSLTFKSLPAPYPKITEAETLRLWHTLLTSGRPAVK